MEIKIYIDILLLVNVMFDYLLLRMTGLLLRQRSGPWRMPLAACLGGLYAVCVFFLPTSLFYSLPGKLAIGALMVAIAFRPCCLRVFIKYICVFYSAVFIWGGAAFGFFYFSDLGSFLGAVYRNGTLYVNLPVYRLLLLTLLCWLILNVAFRLGAHLSAQKKQLVPLRIYYKGKTARLRGFYDSGNLLRDEIGGNGVMIAEWQRVRHLFENFESPQKAAQAESELVSLTYRTLQGEGRLTAFLPDAIFIEQGRRLIQTKAVYIALCDRTLDYYNNWDTILPWDFEGVEHSEETYNEKTVDEKTVDAFCRKGKAAF